MDEEIVSQYSMFTINQSNSKNQLIENKNLLKHEQRINRKEEKAVVKLTWPTLLTTINSSRKGSTGNKFSSFFQVLWVCFFFSLAIGNLPFLTIHSDRQLFWDFSSNATTQTDWIISREYLSLGRHEGMSKQLIASFKNRENRDNVAKLRDKCVAVSILIPII